MQEKIALEVCPFCGADAAQIEKLPDDGLGTWLFARCGNCAARTGGKYGANSIEKAAEKWNRRDRPAKMSFPAGIKACPFCGYRAEVVERLPGHYVVECKNKNCAAESFIAEQSQKGAIERWNRRGGDEEP